MLFPTFPLEETPAELIEPGHTVYEEETGLGLLRITAVDPSPDDPDMLVFRGRTAEGEERTFSSMREGNVQRVVGDIEGFAAELLSEELAPLEGSTRRTAGTERDSICGRT